MARFSFSALLKSKRLLYSLPAVAVVTVLGAAGIWQAQQGKKTSKKSSSAVAKADKRQETSPKAEGSSTRFAGDDSPAAPPRSPFTRSNSARRESPSRFSPARQIPSPQETIVRGNGADARFVDSGDEAADDAGPTSPPPSQSPFGRRGGSAASRPAKPSPTAIGSRRPAGGAFQPPAMAIEETEEPAEEEQPADETDSEQAEQPPARFDSAEHESEEEADASAEESEDVADIESEEDASFAEAGAESPAGDSARRAALSAPVELSIEDDAEINARPLRNDRPRASDAASAGDSAPLSDALPADASSAEAALAVPGPRQLEGPQTPTLTIEKISPPEMQVNRPASLKTIVRNVGQVAAQDVMVFDQVPRGARLQETTPPASQGPDGAIVWQLGDLAPGEQAEVTMKILPQAEGELGSVAKVAFQAQVTARALCTRPQLSVKQAAPARVLIGQQVLVSITISNPGTGAAENVVLEETLPEGLTHSAGRELEYEVGLLRPGESRTLELALVADKAGRIDNRLIVRGAGELAAEDSVEIEVIAPELDVAVKGPAKRYLQRPATYNIALLNEGTAPAKNVELVSYLPKGLKFMSANNQGRYDAPNHAVYWSLDELPAGAKGDVQVTAEPIEVGEQKLRVEGRADLGLTKVLEQVVLVEGLAELFYTVTDSADPIEVGADTIYQIRVINQGSKVDTNVQVAVELPPELEPLAGEGPVRYEVQGQQVVFEPLPRLGPQEEAVFKVQVRGTTEGDHKAKVLLQSDETRTPVSKEEGTRVYAD